VVEAKGKAYGVVESPFKTANWQAAGLIKQIHTDAAVQAWVGLEINGKTVEGANVYTDADRGYAIGKFGPIAGAIGVPDGGRLGARRPADGIPMRPVQPTSPCP
jgi:hypothetical protein